MCKEANDAGKFYIENDFILSGAVMMPCPNADEFVEWAKNVPKADITYEEVKNNFYKLVNALDPGLTEIIFHPSFETENMKTIIGSWQQRAWEADMFADLEMIRFFEENDIILTTWHEVMERFDRK